MTAHTVFAALKTRLERYAPHLFIAAAIMLAYSGIYHNTFLYDDEGLITGNDFLRDWRATWNIFTSDIGAGETGRYIQSSPFYRPLQIFLYQLVYQGFGLSTVAFHALNVALHIACAWMMLVLGRAFGFAAMPVFLATLLWALHPLHTEAVTYMSATADPLYTLLCLLGCWALLLDFAPRRMALACGCFILALLAKESAALFPLLVVACIFLMDPVRARLRTYLKTWPLWIVLGVYVLIRRTMTRVDFYNLPPIYQTHPEYRIDTFFATLPEYLRLILWPTGLHIEWNFPIYIGMWNLPVLLGMGMVALALAQLLWGRGRRGLALSFGLVWFGAAHVLHTGLFWPVNALFLEHWMYLPTLGLMLGLGAQLARTADRRQVSERIRGIAIGICLGTAIALGIATYTQNQVWRDQISLFSNILRYNPNSLSAHQNLGIAYIRAGEQAAAIAQFRTILQMSEPNAQAHYGLALALLSTPDYVDRRDPIIAELQRATDLNPHIFTAYALLAKLYDERGDAPKAAHYRALYAQEAPNSGNSSQ